MSPFQLAVSSLLRRPVTTFIAVLSISIAVAVSGILLRLYDLSQKRFSTIAQGGNVIVAAKAGGVEILLGALNSEGKYPGFMPYVLFESMQAQPSLKTVSPFLYFGRLEHFRLVGTDDSILNFQKGFQEGRWASQQGEVVVGSQVAKDLGLKMDDTIKPNLWYREEVSKTTLDLRVVGILNATESNWDRVLFSNIETAHHALSSFDLSDSSIWGHKVLNYFLIDLEPSGFKPFEHLVNRRTVGQAVLIQEQKTNLKELTGAGSRLGLFTVILILFLGALSVTSMLITRFEAMSLQLAVLRAIGYKKTNIGSWLLWEGILLGTTACLIGLILDAAGFPLLRASLGQTLPSPEALSIPLWRSYPVWITAITATVCSIFIPLHRIYKQDVHFSLRN